MARLRRAFGTVPLHFDIVQKESGRGARPFRFGSRELMFYFRIAFFATWAFSNNSSPFRLSCKTPSPAKCIFRERSLTKPRPSGNRKNTPSILPQSVSRVLQPGHLRGQGVGGGALGLAVATSTSTKTKLASNSCSGVAYSVITYVVVRLIWSRQLVLPPLHLLLPPKLY